MDSGATTALHGPVAVIRFRHPPVNTLAHAMRLGVHEELRKALDDRSIMAVVLTGEGRGFCAGAQRLPRALGVKRALRMMLDGERLPAREFAGTAFIDGLSSGDVLEEALAVARQLIAHQAPLRRLRDSPVPFPEAGDFFAVELARITAAYPGMFAPPAIAQCVQAAVSLPFEEGLRAAFFAERKAGGR